MHGLHATVSPVAAFATLGDTLTRAALSLHRPDEWPEVLSVSQVAQLLQAGRQTIRDQIISGRLDAIRVGNLYRVPAESVWPLIPDVIRNQWPDGPWQDASRPEQGSSDTQGEPDDG
jgi:excisionase family DNA binding protein